MSGPNDPYERQELVVPDEFQGQRVMVVGVGAVGRPIALLLAQMGVRHVALVDPDSVELPNVATQGYLVGDIGEPKVLATSHAMGEVGSSPYSREYEQRFSEVTWVQGDEPDLVFCCVDDMEVRKEVFEACRESYKRPVMVEGRLAGDYGRIFTCTDRVPDSWDKWLAGWFPQTEAEPNEDGRCTTRMTAYAAQVLAGLMVRQAVEVLRVEDGWIETTLPTELGVDLAVMALDRGAVGART